MSYRSMLPLWEDHVAISSMFFEMVHMLLLWMLLGWMLAVLVLSHRNLGCEG
jgi:hypothetical protein